MKIIVLIMYHPCFLRSGQRLLLHTALCWLKSKCQEQDYQSIKYHKRNTLVLNNLQLYFIITSVDSYCINAFFNIVLNLHPKIAALLS